MKLMLVFIASVALAMATGVEEPSDEECCGKVEQCLARCREPSKVPKQIPLPPVEITTIPPEEEGIFCDVVKTTNGDPISCTFKTENDCSKEELEEHCQCLWVVSRGILHCHPSNLSQCFRSIVCL